MNSVKSIKYGAKLWSINSELYEKFVDLYNNRKADYLELLYVPGEKKGIKVLINKNIPVLIHGPTCHQNVCFGDDRFEYNSKMLLAALEFSKGFNSDGMIIHPEMGEKENFIKLLKKHSDKNLIIENMPKKSLNGTDCLGYTIEDIKEFLEIGDFDFCLDFGHAIKSAISQKINYKNFLTKIMKLQPKIVHICDGHLDNEEDEHLSLGEGEFDLKFIANLIKSNSVERITLEVPKINGLSNDIKNIDILKSVLK